LSSSSDSRSSITLLEKLRGDPRNEEAWAEFVRRYRDKITGWCLGWGLQEADAEDVTQIVLLKLSDKMREFRYDPTRGFRAWLRTVTRHAWSDFVSSPNRAAGSGDSRVFEVLHTVEARADLERQLEESFDRELLETALLRVQGRVAAQTWEAFRLTTLEGLSGAEAGQRIPMPVAHVFVAKRRVQKMLQEEIHQLEGPGEDT
jgi:RNA polymerase sigma-70 factor (ECF subfamily)